MNKLVITFVYGPRASGKTTIAQALRQELAHQGGAVPPVVEAMNDNAIRDAVLKSHRNKASALVVAVNGVLPDFKEYALLNTGGGEVLEATVYLVQTVGRINS